MKSAEDEGEGEEASLIEHGAHLLCVGQRWSSLSWSPQPAVFPVSPPLSHNVAKGRAGHRCHRGLRAEQGPDQASGPRWWEALQCVTSPDGTEICLGPKLGVARRPEGKTMGAKTVPHPSQGGSSE